MVLVQNVLLVQFVSRRHQSDEVTASFWVDPQDFYSSSLFPQQIKKIVRKPVNAQKKRNSLMKQELKHSW